MTPGGRPANIRIHQNQAGNHPGATQASRPLVPGRPDGSR